MAAAPEEKTAPLSPEKAREKYEKRMRTRVNVMNELISTEETYLNGLKELVTSYVEPLRDYRNLTADQHMGLFPSDILTIVGLNDKFLTTLKEIQESWDNETSLLGSEFITFAPFFKMYQNYVNNHENATQILRTLSGNAGFDNFCSTAQSTPGGSGLNLPSLLILPIQRVPRYELCLRELLKNTEPEHPDYDNLTTAFEEVRRVNGMINQSMKEHNARDKVREIERRLGGVSLITPARAFIREGPLIKVCRKRDRPYIFILFTDMLMYCSPVTSATEQNLKVHNQLPLNEVFEVVDIESSTKYADRCFEIHSSVKSFLVYADTVAEKYEWMHTIRDANAANQLMAGNSPARPAPVWHPDDFSDHCMVCMNKYTLLRRRHHCRYCGKLVCGDCSQNRMPNLNPEERQTLVRVCLVCFEKFSGISPDDLQVLSDDDDSDGLELEE